MMKLLPIRGDRITLRRLRRPDARSLQQHADNPAVARFLPLLPHPYGMHDAYDWINTTHRQARKDRGYHFGVTVDGSDEVIGVIGLNNVNHGDRNAETGYWLAESQWNQGLGKEMLDLILRFAFTAVGLHRVYAIVQHRNLASIKTLERCGFVREGCYREASLMDGSWHDVFIYGILDREYRRLRAEPADPANENGAGSS